MSLEGAVMHMGDTMIGVLFIDIYKSILIKLGEDAGDVSATFESFHKTVDGTFSSVGGQRWHSMGDGAIFTFPSARRAVQGALRLLAELTEFDGSANRLASSLHVRIGIHEAPARELDGGAPKDRGVKAGTALDIAGKLEKHCPVGKIALSQQAYRTLDAVHAAHFRRPAIGTPGADPTFVLDRRNHMPRERALGSGLTDAQMSQLPPIPFRDWGRLVPREESGLRNLPRLLEEPFLVVLGESTRDPAGSVQGAATSDAVGVMEIMAVLRSNPDVVVGLDRWTDTADFACGRSVVLVGSGIVNSYAFAFNDLVKAVRFAKGEGRVVDQIVAETADGSRVYGAHALPPRDCGFVAVFRSPVNPEKHVVWIAGITGMGTQAAARFAWDLVQDTRATLAKHLGAGAGNPTACLVAASTPSGSTDISAYYRRWRIADYVVLLATDSEGRVLHECEAPA